jgi:hypothetical protein
MEVYRRETEEVIKRFLERKLSYERCIAALDAALAGLMPTLTGKQLGHVRALMRANNKTVVQEMKKRGLVEKITK